MAKKMPLLNFLCQKDEPSVKDILILRWKLAGHGTCKEVIDELTKPCYKIMVSDDICPNLKGRELCFTDFTNTNAFNTYAFGGFLGVSVMQYFYCKYKLKLKYPYLPLMAHTVPSGHHVEYHPLELLDIHFEN
uniref:PAZ domain-containing protein n=1 Tax=Panagrolaimus davidi TaxID=227884 RepID=A0A914PFS2_9BILA